MQEIFLSLIFNIFMYVGTEQMLVYPYPGSAYTPTIARLTTILLAFGSYSVPNIITSD